MVIHILEISNACFNWCKEQHFIHQKNLEIQDLGIVAIALVSLVINHAIYEHSEFIKEKTSLTQEHLEKIFKGTSYLVFILLIMFLVYQIIKFD